MTRQLTPARPLTYLCLFIILLSTSIKISGQTFGISQTVPIPALSVCTDTVTFSIDVLVQNLSGSTGNSLTLDLGPGAHYIAGSIMVSATSNASTMIPPSITVTEFDVSDENMPIFTVSDLDFADRFIATYSIALDCSVIGMPVSQNVVIATMNGSIGSTNHTSDQYNASNGVMNILPNGPGANQSPNLNFANAVVGQSYTRTIRIRNGGSQVKSFMFYDTTQAGLSVVPVSGATIVSTVPLGSASIITYLVNDFTGIGNNNTLFETNETIEIIQNVTVLACTGLISRFGANFGCYGQVSCGSVTGTNRLGGASLNPSVQPNIETTIRRDPYVCLDEPLTGIIVLRNTGTDAAQNVNITLYKSLNTNVSGDSRLGYLDTASISYLLYNNGVPTFVDPSVTSVILGSASADGCGFGLPRQCNITIPLIPAGDSVVISADFIGCCNEPCTRNRYIRDGFAFSANYVNGCGTSPRNIAPITVLLRTHMQQEVLIEAPTDINDGEVFSFYLDVTRYFFANPPVDFTHNFVVTLPPGVMYSGNPADIELLRSNGTLFPTYPPISYDALQNTITFSFNNSIQMQQGMKILFNNMMGVCAKGSGGAISADAFLLSDPACTCEPHTMCVSTAIQLHCPGCMESGMINRDFEIYRVNLGPPDNNNDGIPDNPPGAYSPFVKTKYAIHCDTFESVFTGVVSVLADAPASGFTHGFAIDSSQVGNRLIPVSARVVITEPGPGGNVYACDNLPFGSTGLYNWADFSIAHISGCGYSPTFQNGDTVRVYIRYAVADGTRYSGVFQYPMKTRYYLSDQTYIDAPFTSPQDPRMWMCDNYSGEYGLAGLYDASNGIRSITHQSCDTLITINDYFLGVGPSQYYAGGNFFSHEYRPISIYDTMTINIPVGYTYQRAIIQYNYTGNDITTSIDPIDPMANPLVFDVSPLFDINGGPLPVADEGHRIIFRVFLLGGCLAPVTSSAAVTMQQRSVPVGKFDHLVQGSFPYYATANNFSYNKPNISISSAEPIVQASKDTVTWDIALTNTTPFPANNVWFAELMGGTIEFIQAQEINCTTGALIGGILTDNGMGVYETGTIGGNAQKCYRITGRITTCDNNDITISSGWDCGGYPADITSANCSADLLLQATLLESGLNIQIVSQPISAVELCETVQYEIVISNPNVGRTEDIVVSMEIPGGLTGFEIIPSTSYLRFPASTGAYPALPNLSDPTFSGGVYLWIIPNALIGGSGLDGTLLSPNNQFRIRFDARTVPCDIKSGIRFFFNATGTSPCGEPVSSTPQATQRINLIGSIGTAGAFVVNTVVENPKYCIVDSTEVSSSILYIGSVVTDGNEKLTFTIPADYTIVPGSYMASSLIQPTSGPNLIGSNLDGNLYQFDLPAGIIIGDEVSVSFAIAKANPNACALDSIILTESSRIFQATCSTDAGIMCDLIEVTGDDRDTMSILPAVIQFSGPLDTTVTCFNLQNYLMGNGGFTLSDFCSSVSLSSSVVTLPPCLIDGLYTVKWVAEDNCGNKDSVQVNVTVIDTIPPVFMGVPADVTVSCSSNVLSPPPTSSIMIADDCALSHTVTIVDEITNQICPNKYTLSRYFIAENECGKRDTVTQTITVVDTIKPMWMTLPQDLYIQCGDLNNTTLISNWVSNAAGAMAFDNCNEPVIMTVTVGVPVTICGGTSVTPYEVRATDVCGNFISAPAYIHIIDNIPPVLTVPSSTNQNCATHTSATLNNWLALASAVDGCGGTVVVVPALLSAINSCSGNNTLNTLTYIFTATDDCGNISTGTSQYIIQDNTPPQITAPANITLSCGDNLAAEIGVWLQDYSVVEACQDFTVSNNFNGQFPSLCGGTMLVTWTVTDDCGATASTSASIVLSPDTTPPVFINCPNDISVNVDVDICGANVIYSTPVAMDCNSPVSVTLLSGIASGNTFPVGTTTIVFRASDACNNTSTCSFNITVIDSDIPSISCPSNSVMACASNNCVWVADNSVNVSGLDNCPGSTISYSISGATSAPITIGMANGVQFNIGTSTILYTVTAANGATSTCSFSVIVEDCTAPVITCPTNLTVECANPNLTSIIDAWTATASDNCTGSPSIAKTLLSTTEQCGNTETRLYMFTATDASGNSSVCFAQVDILDNTAPTISMDAQDITVSCDGAGNFTALLSWLNNHGGAVASDVCGDLTWSNDFSGLSDLCGYTGTTSVVFTATDACGNTSTTDGVFTIQDVSPPTITVPVPITVSCGNSLNSVIVTNWLNSAIGSDVCSDVTISNDYPVGAAGPATCTVGPLTVTWTVTDACGLTSTATSTISTQDAEKPIIMVEPANLFIECTDPDFTTIVNNWVNNFGNAMVVDDCDPSVTLSFTAGIPFLVCGNSTVTPYTLTGTDDCGNSVVAYAELVVVDNTPPVLTLPIAPASVSCSGDIQAALNTWLNSASALDGCGGTTNISYALVNQIESCSGNTTVISYIYQFVAEDDCGNSVSNVATFTIVDDVAPIIMAPSNLILSCGDDYSSAIIAWLDDYTVTELCQDAIVSNNFNGVLPNTCGGDITITWTVTDDCGATGSTSAMIVINDDTQGPTFANCPTTAITVGVDVDVCGAYVVYSTPIANDCNGPVAVSLTSGLPSGTLFPVGNTVIVFTATDACNNTSTCSFIIEVLDTDVPLILCPDNDVVVCTDLDMCTWTADNAVLPIGIENCPNAAISFQISGVTSVGPSSGTAVGQVFNLGTSIVTYTITDAVGNVSSCSFNVVVNDCQSPSITCNDQLMVACGLEDINGWYTSIASTITDNCSTTANMSVDTLLITDFSSCGNTIHRVYMFTVTDAAGNTTTCTATYRTIDVTPPVIDVSAVQNPIVQCNDIANNQTLLAWLDDHAGLTATDGCAQPVIWTNNYNGIFSDLCGNTGAITVTFTATDACGNSSTSNASFTIIDTVEPVLSCPQDLTVDCNNINTSGIINLWLNSASALDECDFMVDVTNNFSTTSFMTTCGAAGTYIVTFTATDDCGNTSSCMRNINIIDEQVPFIVAPAMDTIVECGPDNTVELANWLANHGGALADDACSMMSELVWQTPQLINTIDQCGNTITYIYHFRVADACGNLSAVTTARFIIEDNTPPVITTLPSNSTVECDGSGNLSARLAWLNAQAGAVATDICGGPLNWTYDLVDFVEQCGFTGIYSYRFTVSDDCGNITSAVANFIIEDTTSPIITNVAQPLNVECDGANNADQILNWLNNNGFATASEQCGQHTWTNNYGSIGNTCGTSGSVTVIFTVTDACGNFDTTSATFTITDNTAPFWEILPQSLTIECDGTPDPFNQISAWLQGVGGGEAEDSCSLVVYTNDFNSLTNGCSANTGSAIVTFTATDACANSTTATATVSVVDMTPPEIITGAADLTVECDGQGNVTDLDNWIADNGGAEAMDLCSNDPLVWSNTLISTIESCGNTVMYRYAFRATDACGNTSVNTEANFIIEDTTSPDIVTPAQDLTVECDGSGNTAALSAWLSIQGGAVAMDICSEPLVWSYDLVSSKDSCGITGRYTYRFTVTDDCGNTAITEADFVIEDTTAPEITMQAQPLTAQCDGANNASEILNWLNNNGFAQAQDMCGEMVWTNDYGSVTADCGTTGSVLVTFTVEDECGNSSQTSATFTIQDNIPPAWEILPQNLTIECDGTTDPYDQINAWLNTVGGAEAEDSCSLVVYTNDFDGLSDGCSLGTGSAVVTFTASDACGNTTTATATIDVVDRTAPTIVVAARDTIVECDGLGNVVDVDNWLANSAGAFAFDQCSTPLTWSYSLVNTINTCGNTSRARYAFRVTDACGNTSIDTEAEFIIIDTTIPVFDVLPQDITVQCDGLGNLTQLSSWLNDNAGLMASDVCNDIINIEYDLIDETDLCAITGSKLYRFTVFDACGNTNSGNATFTIVDTIPPTIMGGADMNMEECIAPPSGNYPEFDFWLTNHAGAKASDECSDFIWSNNFNPDNWVQQCGNTRYVDVTFYATDVCQNVDSVLFRFSIGDVTPPTFINCPRPPIIVDAPEGWCTAYVNYSLPLAIDNCDTPIVTQTDTTGLQSGDLFPVGLTILEYTATDACGNTSICTLKIVVNDYHTPPAIQCPIDTMVVNDLGVCGALVNNIGPVSVEDNCPDHLAVTFEIKDSLNDVIHTGVEDASGFVFPVGENQVKYTVFDQPILLITEIVQDGNVSGVEIGNFGPASYNISCLNIIRSSLGVVDTFVVPNPVIIPVGGVYTHLFTSIPAGQIATYSITFIERIIDFVTINDGALDGVNIIRISVVDTDTPVDFTIANPCNEGSFGVWNPQLPIFPDNGATVTLQSEDPSMDMCQFVVSVIDIEAPQCAQHDTLTFSDGGIILGQGVCIKSEIIVGAGIVSDVNINNLLMNVGNAGAVTMTLTSPEGTTITLISDICEGQPNIDIDLDDQVQQSVLSAPCNALGNGDAYRPLEAFKAFFGQSSAGVWTLDVYLDAPSSGTLDNWELEILNAVPYMQGDTLLQNDLGDCGALFTWTHPVFNDNCCVGSMTVTYIFENDTTKVYNTFTEDLLNTLGTIDLDGTVETRYFAVGKTTVIYTLIDQYGNENECSFMVTVLDTEVPTFPFGCSDREFNLAPGECTISLGEIPRSLDNCGVKSIMICDQNGDPIDINFLPIGAYVLAVKVTDIYGNVGICTFDVEVNEYIPSSSTLSCNNSVNLSLGADCTATINADMILEGGPYRCYENYCIEIRDAGGNIVPNLFTIADIDKIFTVSIIDCLGSGNSCWGTVRIEYKLLPEILCPPDFVNVADSYCNFDIHERYPEGHPLEGQLLTGEVTVLSCVPGAVITYEDHIMNNGTCSSPRVEITRRWRVADNKGNFSTCDQLISLPAFDPSEIQWPLDYIHDTALSCKDVANNPNLTSPQFTGYPMLNGKSIFGNHYCDINVGYEDYILKDANCPAAYEIIRTWLIRNECLPLQFGVNPIIHLQSIKIDDRLAPDLLALDDITVSVGPWDCKASLVLPTGFLHEEDCSGYSIKWIVPYGQVIGDTVYNLLKGTSEITAKVTDGCGNTARTSFVVTVIDGLAPVAVAKQNLVLSLTGGGVDGTAKLYAEQVDNGSYDYCSPVRFEIRRLSGGTCDNEGENQHNNNASYNNHNGYTAEVPNSIWFHPDDNRLDTDNSAYVKFCCEDIPIGEQFGLHDVELRVWDDGNMNGIIGDNLIINGMRDNYNTTWATVRVENKLPPSLVCPPDVTVTCDMDINLSVDGMITDVNDVDLSMTGYPSGTQLCGALEVVYTDQWIGTSKPECKIGTIRRTFTARKGSETVSCSQLIVLQSIGSGFTVSFPQNNGTTEWSNCHFSLSDAANIGGVNPHIKKPIVNSAACDIIGESIKIDTFLIEDGTCKKWKVEYIYINWCSGEELGPFIHYYTLKDENAPVISCSNIMVNADPNSSNTFGNCEGQVELSAFGSDSLTCTDESWLKWQMLLDGWNDGTIDRLASSYVNPSWTGVWVNIKRILPSGGTNPVWTELQIQHQGIVLSDDIYVTFIRPSKASGSTVTLPSFSMPMENISHKVIWKVSDGCGNVDQCESVLMVVDKKAPTPYCTNISTALMLADPNMVELWAKDFDKGAVDNCTPDDKLMFTFSQIAPQATSLMLFGKEININTAHYFDKNGALAPYPIDLSNATQRNVRDAYLNSQEINPGSGIVQLWDPLARSSAMVFTDAVFLGQSSVEVDVDVSVWDQSWNSDFCTVLLKIVCGFCPGMEASSISGQIITAFGSPLENASIVIDADLPEFPIIKNSDKEGNWSHIVLNDFDYAITAQKNDDYPNGVSTIDLVKIQRHILGLELFDSPYQYIAADANNNESVSSGDLTALRKLILGIYNELPDNQSWRFVASGQNLISNYPWPFVEKHDIGAIKEDQNAQDFVAVKIGDINGTAIPNVRSYQSEIRSKSVLTLDVVDKVLLPNGRYDILLTAGGNISAYGFQFTLDHPGLIIEDIGSEYFDVSLDNMAQFEGYSTFSVDSHVPVQINASEVVIRLRVRSKLSGMLSENISLSSKITANESYFENDIVGKVDIVFHSVDLENMGYGLRQNLPNPFKDETSIEYNVPSDMTVIFKVYDMQGQMIWSKDVAAQEGYNVLQLTSRDILRAGTYYYMMIANEVELGKKMIKIE